MGKTYDSEARARIARGWAFSSLSQADYCANFGISVRTLRDWTGKYGGASRPQAHLREAIVATIEQLQAMLDVLDAEAAAASADAEHEDAGPAEAADTPDAPQVSVPAGTPEAGRPIPMPAAGFPWF